MIKIQIKSYLGTILFEYEKDGNTIRDTVIEAVKYGANLRYANLYGADLRGANLRYADLHGANLCDANLRYANLGDANLGDADLRYANLGDANLCASNLHGADLRGAKNILSTERHRQCMQNILYILSYLKQEVEFLRQRLIEGKVNGSQYVGKCCCLIGTLGKEKGLSEVCNIIPFYDKGTHNYGEQRFLQIKEGDKEGNIFVDEAIKCCDIILNKK